MGIQNPPAVKRMWRPWVDENVYNEESKDQTQTTIKKIPPEFHSKGEHVEQVIHLNDTENLRIQEATANKQLNIEVALDKKKTIKNCT